MKDFERQINRELVRYAVQRQIWCPRCGAVLEYLNATLITLKGGQDRDTVNILCNPCLNKVNITLAQLDASGYSTIEFIDGSTGDLVEWQATPEALEAERKANRWKTAEPYRSAANITGEQLPLIEEV